MSDRHALQRGHDHGLRRGAPPSAGQLLARVLDEPALPAQVQALPATALATLIERIGLEDAGELIALATTDQLVAVFDEDLWRSERAGEDAQLDPARFVRWLEVLGEAGEVALAARLAALPEELLVLALHRQVLVLDVDALAAQMQNGGGGAGGRGHRGGGDDDDDDDDGDGVDQLDKALESCLWEEVDGYQLVARRHDGWDTVLSAILALDCDHHALVVRLLDRCVALDGAVIEEHGLHRVLTAAESAAEDAAGARDDRRGAAGYVAPSSASAFLKLAAVSTATPDQRDPITRAYFRDADAASTRAASAHEASTRAASAHEASTRAASAHEASTRAASAHEAGAGAAPDGLRRLVASVATSDADADADGEPQDDDTRAGAVEGQGLLEALRALAVAAPDRFALRQAELAYLANVLVAGATLGAGGARRRVRPVEALRAAAAVVARGVALVRAGQDPRDAHDEAAAAVAILAAHGADGLFRRGWARLHHEATAAGRACAATDLAVVAIAMPTTDARRRRDDATGSGGGALGPGPAGGR